MTGPLTGIAVNLAAYMFTGHGQSTGNVREIAAVMPLGAALAGRVLGAQVRSLTPPRGQPQRRQQEPRHPPLTATPISE